MSVFFINIALLNFVKVARLKWIDTIDAIMVGMVLILMILIQPVYGTVQRTKHRAPSYPLVLFYFLGHIISYFLEFGLSILSNQQYGSIGTLLIMMFYIWINCMILLLGLEK
jgi:membrane protein